MQRGFSLALLIALATVINAAPIEDLARPVAGQRMRASGHNQTGLNKDHAVIEPGQTITVAELNGPGEIRHIWFTVSTKELRFTATTILRIYWDDAAEPSVEAPLGDFFCAGNGMRTNIISVPVQVSAEGRAFNCYWPMPFNKKARIEAENQSVHKMTALYYYIDWQKLEAPRPDLRYFHARFRQERPHQPPEDYTILDTKGTGHYVGTVLSSQDSFNGWFGEGDDFFYIDDATTAQLTGTGTEDYFNDAWGFREFCHPYAGCPIFEGREIDSRITAYRWHIPDPVSFTRSLRVTIENKGWIFKEDGQRYTNFGDRQDNYSSVAYWYQTSQATGLPRMAPLAQRMDREIWFDAEDRINDVTASTRGQARTYGDRVAIQGNFVLLDRAQLGDWIQFPIAILEKGRYSLSAWCILMPQGGIYQVLLDGRVIEPRLDCYNHMRLTQNEPARKSIERKLGLHDLDIGPHQLRFVCIGRNANSYTPGSNREGYDLGVDVISLRKIAFENMDARLPPLPATGR